MEKNILLIDEYFEPVVTKKEADDTSVIIKDFVNTYAQHKDEKIESWLPQKMHEYLPEKSKKEIEQYSEEIILSLKVTEQKKEALKVANDSGVESSRWLAGEIENASSALSMAGQVEYLQSLDKAVSNANEAFNRTILTQAGEINMNPNLDGFIAEQYHAQTFNLNAEATGSPYRAKVLEPNGHGYAKNSVDIEVVDGNGKVQSRYQLKYCKDAEATRKAFEQGKYNGQRSTVASDQVDPETGKIDGRKCTTYLEAPDGTKSNELTKAKAKQIQEAAQSGNFEGLDWNEFKTKDLAVGIGKNAVQAGAKGLAISTGMYVLNQVVEGNEIDGAEVVEKALEAGTDAGVKAAAGGALKVAAEKGMIKLIPPGTPASTVANVAFVAVENVKILWNLAKGKINTVEAMDQIGNTTTSVTAGLIAMSKGASIGASLGTVLGPVGTVVGGIVGGAVGYAAGSKVGHAVYETGKKVCKTVIEKVRKIGNAVKEGTKNFIKKVFA